MFTGFSMTDILGSRNIDNDTPFIIVSSDNLHKLLDKVKFVNPYTIYRANMLKLGRYVRSKTYTIDLANFVPVGDMCSNRKITKILLANKHVVPTSPSYTRVGRLGGMSMWIAEMKRKNVESRSLGIVLTNGNSSPTFRTPVIPKSYLVRMDFGRSLLKGNDFNVLNVRSDGLWILIRNKFINPDSPDSPKWGSYGNFKYIDKKGNYLSVSTENDDVGLLPENSRKQKIRLTSNNQLAMNDKCLEVTSSGKIKLRKCSNNRSQKWIPNGSNFISASGGNFNKCLGYDHNGNIKLQECNKTEWTKQDYDEDDVSDIQWRTVRGKTLVLKNRDDPWFMNEKIVKSREYIKSHLPKALNEYDSYAKSAVNCGPKEERISYDDVNIHCKSKEGFHNNDKNYMGRDGTHYMRKKRKRGIKGMTDSFILLLLIIVLLILVIIKLNRNN